MCGICGYYSTNNCFSHDDLIKATQSLAHRGPDAEGIFQDKIVGFGHRRLSIIDLSSAANQPMHSHCGRYVMVYNGEVYNFKEIAKELNITQKTSSDTEIILEAFAKWGTGCVHHFNGMFAFAIYDKQKKKLFLFRDRMGIKPLYYFYDGKNFAFASELKALTKISSIHSNLSINKTLISTFLYIGYIPEPYSIYNNIYKLPAGTILAIDTSGLNISPYWTLKEQIEENVIENFAAAKEKFKELITSSVQYRLISDVPYGIFLSGGVDSSLITAVARQLAPKNVKTFSIGFKEEKYNEAPHARAVAEYLKTDHHEFIVSHRDAIPIIEELLSIYDEPYADSSSIPTLLISKLARQHVKMVLSGDGGDELFFGYGSYKWAERLSNPTIHFFRKPISFVLSHLSAREKRAGNVFSYSKDERIKSHIFSQEQYCFSETELTSLLHDSCNFPFAVEEKYESLPRKLSPAEEQAFFDLHYYLRDELLVKVDRATMHFGLEDRLPYLDYRIIKFALNLSPNLKIKNGIQKFLLKETLYDYIPKKYFDRPKWGFAIPIRIWLRNELKYLLEEYLSEKVIREAGIVKFEVVKKIKKEFINGNDFLFQRLWLLIVLHKFLKEKK